MGNTIRGFESLSLRHFYGRARRHDSGSQIEFMNTKSLSLLAVILLPLAPALVAHAEEQIPSPSDLPAKAEEQTRKPSEQERKSMVEMHEKMAECLKSSRSFDECRNEMRQNMQAFRELHGYECPGCGQGMMKRKGKSG